MLIYANRYHNSILITKNENRQKYVIRNDNNRSILFILNVNHEDSGNYEIRIINKHGLVQQSAHLHVGASDSEAESHHSGFNISINKVHQQTQSQSQSQSHLGEFNELIKFVNVGGARRSESLGRSVEGERRASVTKVVMVKDHRHGSAASVCNCEGGEAGSKRYSITKILPVRQKYVSQDEISISASDYHMR